MLKLEEMRRGMKRKQILTVLGIVIVLAAVGTTTAFAASTGEKVTTQTVVNDKITQTVEAEGHIETENEKVYYATITAPVSSFSQKAGDVVQKGDTLVSFETEDFDREVEKASLQAQALQASYEGSAAQSYELKKAYQEAVTQDAALKESYEATLTNVNELKYNIETVADAVQDKSDAINKQIAQVQIDIAKSNASAASAMADNEYDDSYDYQADAAWLQVKQASLKKELLELPDTGAKPIENRYFSEAEMYLNEIATQRSALQQEMLSTKHAAANSKQLEQIAKNAELANQTLIWCMEEQQKAETGIKADMTGVISEVTLEEGAYVTEGTRLFTLKDIEHVKAVVEVTSYEMGLIKVGQKAEVKVAGVSYQGTVSKIRMETVLDSQNKAKLQVEVHIENPDDKIYLGTDVDVTIETGSSEQAVLIPNTALYADDEGDYCYVIEEGVAVKRYVSCGMSDGDSTEVIEGLNIGEKVITDAMTDESIGKKVVAVQ